MAYTKRQLDIFWIIFKHQPIGVSNIAILLQSTVSVPSINRDLALLKKNNLIIVTGKGPNTKYTVPVISLLNIDLPIEDYYLKEQDERVIISKFNIDLFETLGSINLFNPKEIEVLDNKQKQFSKRSGEFTKQEWLNEMERLAIDLSWKSSQIEGNTYSLLETEQLLKEKKTAAGKTKDEATMLLNHKEAIDFIIDQPNYMYPLTVAKIEDLHSILIKDLAVSKNIRTKRVSITGTNYLPIENEWQIKEALELMCDLANKKENIFEKAFLTLLLISYIQPFMDGNKRTARIVSNAILLHFNYCPLSFRTVDSIDYKKALLLFYEVNNIAAFKKIFIEQYRFAVDTYF